MLCCLSIAELEPSLKTWAQSRTVSQPAVIGSPIGRRTIGPPSSGLGKGLAGSTSVSLWRAGRLHADFGSQLNGVSSDTLVQLASGLSWWVLRRVVWWVMFWRTHDSTFASRAHWGVAMMRQDRNHRVWGKKLPPVGTQPGSKTMCCRMWYPARLQDNVL